jgi:hypothetical protein
VHSSVYCLPADLLGEGAERVAGTVRDRAGVPGVTVAACYHASRDIYPHNPAYRVASLAPGAFYAVDPSAYPGPLRPAVSPSAAGRDILAEACQAAAPLGVQVSAWAVLLHRDDLDERAAGVQENCFGDRFPDAALTWYRAQVGPDAPLSVVLRPGPPDTTTPTSLAEKAQLARSHNCTELNFYACGLYRLAALDHIRPALSTPNPTHPAALAHP